MSNNLTMIGSHKIHHVQASIVLHVMIVASFIVLLFFTLGVRIERKVVEKQIDSIVTDMVGELVPLIPSDQKELIHTLIQQKIQSNSVDENIVANDNRVVKQNTEYRTKAIYAVIGLLVAGCAVLYYLNKQSKLNWNEIASENMFVLAAVAAAEVGFLLLVTQNYQYIDSSYIKLKILDILASS